MKKYLIAAVLAATPLCVSAPAAAQELPFTYGDYWEMSGIEVEDGSAATYIDHLATRWKDSMEFAKSKGWIKAYHVLGNINGREGEPDFYLVSIFSKMADGAETMARDKAYDDHFKTTMRKQEAESGTRAKYRKVLSSQLMGELLLK